MFVLQLVIAIFVVQSSSEKLDQNGYIIFCPCMGRFGNQIDQFLGVLAFSRSLDRTLVLPNFIEYDHPKTNFIPFERIFQLNVVKKYTKVVTMQDFITNIAPRVWPENKRKRDEYYGTIKNGYDTSIPGNRRAWEKKFPSHEYKVLAFSSAPSPFPSHSKHWELQRYLKWSSRIVHEAKKFINETLTKPFVGIHLRNNNKACEHVNTETNRVLFASAQCLGESHHLGKLTKEICLPSSETVLQKVVDAVGSIGAKSVFVASDRDHMIDELNQALQAYDVTAHRLASNDIYTSLAILARSDLFIGNCVSTFSHIVKRERDHGYSITHPTTYFGLVTEKNKIEL